jgi:hypothetical protein
MGPEATWITQTRMAEVHLFLQWRIRKVFSSALHPLRDGGQKYVLSAEPKFRGLDDGVVQLPGKGGSWSSCGVIFDCTGMAKASASAIPC